MKRLTSSDSLGAIMSICRSTEEQSPQNNHVYSREFQSMLDGLDEEGCMEESGHVPEKKRRLSVEQVKALEKNFEVENKLEPDRKVKLALELGLQPRQVAVWFQNRRARWKTKQLERDYGIVKANYDSLKENFESLQHENEALLKEIRELKSKPNEEKTESNLSIKEDEALNSESNNNPAVEPVATLSGSFPLKAEAVDFKEGPSDSDSSAILNEDNSPNGGDGGFLLIHHHQSHQLLISSSFGLNCSSSAAGGVLGCGAQKVNNSYQAQFVKMEEQSLFDEEACNFFSEEQAPTLHWLPDQWT